MSEGPLPREEPQRAGEPDEAAAATEELLARVSAEVREIGRALVDLLTLRIDRTRVGLREASFRLVLRAWLALAAAAATTVAAYFVVVGIAGGLSALLGGPLWLGHLLGGLLVLLLIGLLALAVRARSRSAGLERLRGKYRERRRPSKEETT